MFARSSRKIPRCNIVDFPISSTVLCLLHAYQTHAHFLLQLAHSLMRMLVWLRMLELLGHCSAARLPHLSLPPYFLYFLWLLRLFDLELTRVTYNRQIAPCSYSQSQDYLSVRIIVKIPKRILIGHFIPLSI